MPRKTIDVEFVKDLVNKSLKKSPDSAKEYRQGMMTILESILIKTDNYDGFLYLDEEDLVGTDNKIPGIRRKDGKKSWENTDNTRVVYF